MPGVEGEGKLGEGRRAAMLGRVIGGASLTRGRVSRDLSKGREPAWERRAEYNSECKGPELCLPGVSEEE